MLNSQFAMKCLDASDTNGLTLRAEFIWRGDRYGHVLSVIEPHGQVCPVLESVEGTPADDWPPSPPLQSLSLEEIAPGRRAALLVGMAGRSHWSASVEAFPGEAALVFDIACRVQSDPQPQVKHDAMPALFSEYRSIECVTGAVIADENQQAAARHDRRQWSISLAPLHTTRHSSISPHESVFHAPAKECVYGHTVRWQYRVELKSLG